MSTSKTTTVGQQQQQSSQQGTSGQQFTDPTLAGGLRNLFGQYQRGLQQTQQPLYGQGQIANYLSNLNDLANRSIQSLQGNLARTGGLNSGALASGATQIGLGRMGQQSNFLANVPLMNRQAMLQGAQAYGGLGNQLLSLAPRTQTTQQTGQESGTSRQTQSYTPSLLSDIGQGLGIAGGVMGMPGLSSFMGGGGGAPGAPAPSFAPPDLLNSSMFAGAGSPFGAQVGGGIPGLGPGVPSWLPNPYSLPNYQGPGGGNP